MGAGCQGWQNSPQPVGHPELQKQSKGQKSFLISIADPQLLKDDFLWLLCTFRTPCQQQFLLHISTSGVVIFFALLFLTSHSALKRDFAEHFSILRSQGSSRAGSWAVLLPKLLLPVLPEPFQPQSQASSRVVAKGKQGGVGEVGGFLC